MGPRQGWLGPNIVNNDVWAQSGPDGDPWRPKADFLEAEGRRRGVGGEAPSKMGPFWPLLGTPDGKYCPGFYYTVPVDPNQRTLEAQDSGFRYRK